MIYYAMLFYAMLYYTFYLRFATTCFSVLCYIFFLSMRATYSVSLVQFTHSNMIGKHLDEFLRISRKVETSKLSPGVAMIWTGS
jgi:hypothetical protein